jgi:threonine/homoserine/homoserine lactone efflux protein
MFDSQVLAFAGVALLLTLTPGLDTMLVIKNVFAGGSRAGVFTTLGINTGVFFHATVSALGLSLILVQSALAFEIVKLVGATYLIFLGGQALWQAWRKPPQAMAAPSSVTVPGKTRVWGCYREGLLTNILNPKMAVFYLAFLPQFISPGDPVLAKSLLLAGIHDVMGLIWLCTLALCVGKLSGWLTRPSVRQKLEMTTGAIMVGLGVRLALERR